MSLGLSRGRLIDMPSARRRKSKECKQKDTCKWYDKCRYSHDIDKCREATVTLEENDVEEID